ncbi:hypothetical protein VTK56DRAFT_2987 [Thermocarpiscus australiensis]
MKKRGEEGGRGWERVSGVQSEKNGGASAGRKKLPIELFALTPTFEAQDRSKPLSSEALRYEQRDITKVLQKNSFVCYRLQSCHCFFWSQTLQYLFKNFAPLDPEQNPDQLKKGVWQDLGIPAS